MTLSRDSVLTGQSRLARESQVRLFLPAGGNGQANNSSEEDRHLIPGEPAPKPPNHREAHVCGDRAPSNPWAMNPAHPEQELPLCVGSLPQTMALTHIYWIFLV